MKRIILYLLFGITGTVWVTAQDNSKKNLQLVYIDHEVSTPTSVLNERITTRYYEVVQYPEQESMILYLSNGRLSPVAFVNLEDYATAEQLPGNTNSSQRRDTEDAFKGVLETMNKANSHTVEPLIDINNILSILDQQQVFDENGKLKFKRLRFDFYVGPQFWQLFNNEKVIARLYAIIQQGLQDSDKKKISFNVFKPKDSHLDYPEGRPFGEFNLNGINEILNIMEY